MRNEVYLKYKKMIYRQANDFSKKFHVEIDEVISEANLIYCEASDNFDNNLSSFSTHLWNSLNYRLGTFCKNVISQREKEIANNFLVEMHAGMYEEHYEDEIFFKDVLNKISERERQVINIIFNNQTPRITKNIIKKELIQSGWTRTKVENAFDNIKQAFQI